MNEQFVPFGGWTEKSGTERESVLRTSHSKGGFKFFGGETVTFGERIFTKPVLDDKGQQRKRSDGQPMISVAIQATVNGKDVALSMSTFAVFPKDLKSLEPYPVMKSLVQCQNDLERYEVLKNKTFKITLLQGQGVDWAKSTETERAYKNREFPMLNE